MDLITLAVAKKASGSGGRLPNVTRADIGKMLQVVRQDDTTSTVTTTIITEQNISYDAEMGGYVLQSDNLDLFQNDFQITVIFDGTTYEGIIEGGYFANDIFEIALEREGRILHFYCDEFTGTKTIKVDVTYHPYTGMWNLEDTAFTKIIKGTVDYDNPSLEEYYPVTFTESFGYDPTKIIGADVLGQLFIMMNNTTFIAVPDGDFGVRTVIFTNNDVDWYLRFDYEFFDITLTKSGNNYSSYMTFSTDLIDKVIHASIAQLSFSVMSGSVSSGTNTKEVFRHDSSYIDRRNVSNSYMIFSGIVKDGNDLKRRILTWTANGITTTDVTL